MADTPIEPKNEPSMDNTPISPKAAPTDKSFIDLLLRDPRDPSRKLTYAESRALYG